LCKNKNKKMMISLDECSTNDDSDECWTIVTENTEYSWARRLLQGYLNLVEKHTWIHIALLGVAGWVLFIRNDFNILLSQIAEKKQPNVNFSIISTVIHPKINNSVVVTANDTSNVSLLLLDDNKIIKKKQKKQNENKNTLTCYNSTYLPEVDETYEWVFVSLI